MRLAGLLPSLLAASIGCLAAQTPAPWHGSIYPTGINVSGNTGPQLGIGFGYTRKADSLAGHTLDGSLVVAGGYGWRGSWFGTFAFRAPGLWPGWRLVLTGLAQREARFEFLGVGNESAYYPDSVSHTQPYFYKLRRTRYRAEVEGTRAIRAGWSVALAVGLAHTRYDSLPGPSLFLSTYGPALTEADRTARVSVVFDRRDSEYDPRRGVFLELSTTVGSGGGGYTRISGITRAYISLGRRTTAALKLAGSDMAGNPTLSARFELPVWEGSVNVLGAPVSHRGLRSQRFVGRGVEFGTVEIRRSLVRTARRIELVGAAFLDFGRVFEGEPLVPTFNGLKLGPGLGLGVRLRGKSLVHVYAARGPDGVVVSSRTGWVF